MDSENIAFEGDKAYFILNTLDDDKPIGSSVVIYRLVGENLNNKRGEIHLWLENAITGSLIKEHQKFTMESLSTKLLSRSDSKVNLQSELYDHLVMTGILSEEEFMNSIKKIAISIMENWYLQGKSTAPVNTQNSVASVLEQTSQEDINDAVELLFNVDLLKIIDTEIGQVIIGEYENRIYIFLSMIQAFTPEYPQITVVGESGIGKSYITNCVLSMFPSEIVYTVGRVSKTALERAIQIKDRKILYIQESRGKAAAADSIRLSSSSDGGMKALITNKETGEAEELIVPPLTLITTQTEVGMHHEDETRNTKVFLSSDLEQTRKVIEHQGKEAEFPMDLKRAMGIEDKSKVYIIRNMIRLLKKNINVILPYESEVVKHLVTSKIRIKRDHKKLIGLIKATALLHQAQREWLRLDDEMWIIANVEDLKRAIYYGETPLTQSYHNLDLLGKELLKHLIELIEENKTWAGGAVEGAHTKQINKVVAEKMGYSYTWVTQRLEHMIKQSMVFKQYEAPENMPNGNYYTVSEETYDSIFISEIDFDVLENKTKQWKSEFKQLVARDYEFFTLDKNEILEEYIPTIEVEE